MILITVRVGPACQYSYMNFIRIVTIILAALLLPGGFLLLVPLIYKWSKQRKMLGSESAEIGP